MRKSTVFKWLIPVIAPLLFVLSCGSLDNGGASLSPPRSTSSVRLQDIREQVNANPVYAINLIYIYKEVYSAVLDEEDGDWKQLAQFEQEAAGNLVALQQRAIEEEKWEEAVSFGRSIASLGITTGNTGLEAAYTLADAKKKLSEGDNLGGFLAAVRSHEMQPIDFESALLFLGKAVEARQRRTASFFLSAAERSGGGNIPAALREYAQGRDSVSDMIKGVATVIVDRGIRIERGVGTADWVLGSAFFVDASGLLITNYHVIASEVDPKYKGYSRMYIRMGDSTSPRFPARVIGWDKALDLALIKTEIESEYVFSIVDRVIPRVGDTVLAIGSPVGLEKTVTSGIVSALGRRLLQIGDVVQIDAAVNSGNSGGPVIDTEGRLVGIVFAGVAYYQGLNFAVPAQSLAAALPAMIKGGKVQRPWLGLTLSETYFREAEIIYTAPNTPAALHRVSEGSLIRTINGMAINAPQGGLIPALQEAVFLSGPDELVSLETVDQDGNVKRHVLMTVPRPELPLLDAARVDSRERIAAPLFGMILTRISSGFFSSNNFRVDRVVPGSVSYEAGISQNDPVSIGRLRILEDDGYALLEITVKKQRIGYLETSMRLPAWLDSPDTL
ncbi:MAG: S1C family serine protease [Treponema sp.]|jgi:S1-C subfamily serine protease|nr:S1C family serine protease [Treponema sp.]